MAKFRSEWDAWCDGRPPERRKGTPLSEVVTPNRAEILISANIHTVEELAALNDHQCQGVGHGTLTDRQKARALLQQRQAAQAIAQRDQVAKVAGDIKAAPAAPAPEMVEIKNGLEQLNANMMQLVQLMTAQQKKKPGPKKKDQGDAS